LIVAVKAIFNIKYYLLHFKEIKNEEVQGAIAQCNNSTYSTFNIYHSSCNDSWI